jgi:hypothetical protein
MKIRIAVLITGALLVGASGTARAASQPLDSDHAPIAAVDREPVLYYHLDVQSTTPALVYILYREGYGRGVAGRARLQRFPAGLESVGTRCSKRATRWIRRTSCPWLETPVLHWEESEIECSCKPWASSVQNSPPAPSSQIRAKIEVWQEDIFRPWGGTGESLPLVERDMDVG